LTRSSISICVAIISFTFLIGLEVESLTRHVAFRNVLLKEVGNLLVSFEQHFGEMFREVAVTVIVERSSKTLVTDTSSTAY
jgi:hypothetical protein